MDNTRLHEQSAPLEHLIDLIVFKGHPSNLDAEREVVILVNHGYVVGFSPERLQPVWAAYRVAGSDRDVDYDRPHLYYDDLRLPAERRIGPETFGTHEGVAYDVGHMVPNEATNRQFGRLAQMETFLMSNMSPQYRTLNQGVWMRLETMIREVEDDGSRDHIWAIAGPVFGEDPTTLPRPNGTQVPVAHSYFCITVDPFRYPWDRPSNTEMLCLLIPQDADRRADLRGFEVDLDSIETATKLSFFPKWDRPREVEPARADRAAPVKHRILQRL